MRAGPGSGSQHCTWGVPRCRSRCIWRPVSAGPGMARSSRLCNLLGAGACPSPACVHECVCFPRAHMCLGALELHTCASARVLAPHPIVYMLRSSLHRLQASTTNWARVRPTRRPSQRRMPLCVDTFRRHVPVHVTAPPLRVGLGLVSVPPLLCWPRPRLLPQLLRLHPHPDPVCLTCHRRRPSLHPPWVASWSTAGVS